MPDLLSKITGAFLFQIFGGFLHVPTTQITASLAPWLARRIYKYIFKYYAWSSTWWHDPPPPPSASPRKAQAGLWERPASWEVGRKWRPQQEIPGLGRCGPSAGPWRRSPASGLPGWWMSWPPWRPPGRGRNMGLPKASAGRQLARTRDRLG